MSQFGVPWEPINKFFVVQLFELWPIETNSIVDREHSDVLILLARAKLAHHTLGHMSDSEWIKTYGINKSFCHVLEALEYGRERGILLV